MYLYYDSLRYSQVLPYEHASFHVDKFKLCATRYIMLYNKLCCIIYIMCHEINYVLLYTLCVMK